VVGRQGPGLGPAQPPKLNHFVIDSLLASIGTTAAPVSVVGQCHPLSLPDSRLQSLSRTTNFVARFFFRAEMLFTSDMPTHAHKKTGRGAY
jgi:hypothetical protein